GSLTLERVTITNSHGSQGDAGALYSANQSTLTIANSTFSGNTAAHHAGAILIESGNATLTSVTITSNSSGFSNLTGGIRAGGNVTIRNCLIAGNGGVNLPNVDGLFTSLGHNIIGEYGDTPGNPIVAPAAGDQLDIDDALVNFGPLQHNGGTTPTHELLAGSIAIDAGHSSGTTADQRGLTRPCDLAAVANATGGDGADVGAFEVQGTCAGANTDPDAVDDAFSVSQDSGANVLDVLANDTDADGDPLVVTAVTQGANGSVSNNGTSVSYTPNAGFTGSDSFTYTLDDTAGGTDSASVSVTVLDTEAPEIDVDVAIESLWPPNHELIDVGLSVAISDNGGGFTTATAVYSDEDDGKSPDAAGSLLLRAERSGSGDGRVYLVAVTATDASSNTSHQCTAVVVPKSQSAAHINSVNAQAAAAVSHCNATGTAPAGYFVVGE
ncbi:MAG TPA: Ig-like domain-containing protein, partial [Thermoanaerobaculia bacterium]|nr:Ig-like domain-containing protein [Thermoanaerobaculia bacterium]